MNNPTIIINIVNWRETFHYVSSCQNLFSVNHDEFRYFKNPFNNDNDGKIPNVEATNL